MSNKANTPKSDLQELAKITDQEIDALWVNFEHNNIIGMPHYEDCSIYGNKNYALDMGFFGDDSVCKHSKISDFPLPIRELNYKLFYFCLNSSCGKPVKRLDK